MLVLVDGIKCSARRDVAVAVARRYHADLWVGAAATTEQEYLDAMSVAFERPMVIESSWQTQRVGHLVSNGATAYNYAAGTRMVDLARYLLGVTVHVTSYADTTILCASMEQHSDSLTTAQLALLFRASREWEFPEFKVKPVVQVNPHVDDLNDRLFPAIEEEYMILQAVLHEATEGYP